MPKKVLVALMFWPAFSHAGDLPVPGIWYQQTAVTADYSFSALVITSDDNENSSVEAIKITNRKTGKLLQEIDDIGGFDVHRTPADMVSIIDANFDGRPDFEIPFSDGGAGPNNSSNYYLFDPATSRFKLSQELSELPQSSINPDKTITSASRGSCCQHESATYRYINDKLTLIADWEEIYDPNGWLVETTRKLRNGKWVVREKRTRAPE